MLENPLFWVAIGFVIFIAAAYKPVSKAFKSSMDKRADNIARELKDAEILKKEAEELLQKYKTESAKVREEAEAILESAKKQADRMLMETQHQVEQNVRKHTEIAKQKIAQAELQVAQEIRNHAVEISVSAARSLIMEHIANDGNDELVQQTIKQLNRKFH